MPKQVILVVTKDGTEFLIYHPVVLELEKLGYEVVVVAEGLSMDMWVKSGREVYGGLPKPEHLDSNTKMRSDIDAAAVIESVKPILVLTGLADPINLGAKFGLVARALGVKLGFVEDLWGVHKRSAAVPDFVCTVDGYGARQLDSTYGSSGEEVLTYVTGSPADDALQHIRPDPDTSRIIKSIAAARVVIIGGQDESTTPLLEGLLKASSVGGEGWIIIPRLHPKWMTDPSKAAFRDEWSSLIYRMEEYCRVLWTPPSIDTRTLIPLAAVVVSVYSNCLRQAVALGALPISWTSMIGRQCMSKSLGVESYPAVSLEACIEVDSPEGFSSVLDSFVAHPDFALQRHKYLVNLRKALGLDGHATERVVKAIQKELGS